MTTEHVFKKNLILFFLIMLIVLSYFIIKPFLSAILFSLVLAYAFYPLYSWINKKVKRPNITAAVIVLLVFLVIALPFWFLMPQVIKQTFDAYRSLQKVDIVAPLRKIAPSFFISPEFTRDITVNINQGVSQLTNSFITTLGDAIANFPSLFLQFIIMFIVFFFSLREGNKIIEYLKGFSPFKDEVQKKFLSKFRSITKAVIYNIFGVGVLQGILAGVGYYIFGVSNPLFFTTVSMFFGILPIIGPWIIWAPLAISMIVSGNPNGIYLAIYGLFVVELIYQILIVYVFKRVSDVSPVVSLIGILGGWYLFGIVGFIIGPLVLSYVVLFLEFYRTKRLNELFGE